MDRERLKVEIAKLTWQRFEDLVFDLHRAIDPSTEKMAAPDGGADLIVRREDGTVELVVQAKFYPGSIKWSECEASLDKAVSSWGPARVRFVFPRDLTDPMATRFETRLMRRHKGIEVRMWNLAELVRRLEENQTVATRNFGQDIRSDLERFRRAGLHGGPVETPIDLIDRALDLGNAADGLDPIFEYHVSSGDSSKFGLRWESPSFVALEVESSDGRRARIDAWVREGEEVPMPVARFLDDPAGQKAREEMREAFTRGQKAILTSGVEFELPVAPRLFAELGGPSSAMPGSLEVAPGQGIWARLRAGDGTLVPDLELTLRSIPPPVGTRDSGPGVLIHFAGLSGGLRLEIAARLSRPEMTANLNFDLRLEHSAKAADNLEAHRLLLAAHESGSLGLAVAHIEKGEFTPSEFSLGPDEDVDYLRVHAALFEALTRIEEWSGETIDVPREISSDEAQGIFEAIAVVSPRELEISGELTLICARHVLENFPGDLQVEDWLVADLFGREITIARRRMMLRAAEVVSVEPAPDHGDDYARVVIRPGGGALAPYEIVPASEVEPQAAKVSSKHQPLR